jgi:hypothetical protein
MEETWLTYREAGERLGCTAEVVRYRALRGKWPRRRGNDGRARVQLPEDAHSVRTPERTSRANPEHTPFGPGADARPRKPHQDLTGGQRSVEGTACRERAAFAAREAALAGDLTAEKARADKAIAVFAALAERLDALAAERARPWSRRLVG